MKTSFNAITYYGKRSLKDIVKLLKDSSFDAYELPFVPESHPFFKGESYTKELVKAASEEIGLPVSSICPFFPANLDLASRDSVVRKKGVEYMLRMLELAAEVGAGVVVVVPSAVFKPEPGPFEEEWKYALESLQTIGPHAHKAGIRLAIEPINRFLTTFVNRLDQATKLAREAGEGVAVMADLYHMNMEEPDLLTPLYESADLLVHLHISDSNNGMIGAGHLNIPQILRALKRIGYDGYITVEAFVPDSEAEMLAPNMGMTLKALLGGVN